LPPKPACSLALIATTSVARTGTNVTPKPQRENQGQLGHHSGLLCPTCCPLRHNGRPSQLTDHIQLSHLPYAHQVWIRAPARW
jgi:hypothetical protein